MATETFEEFLCRTTPMIVVTLTRFEAETLAKMEAHPKEQHRLYSAVAQVQMCLYDTDEDMKEIVVEILAPSAEELVKHIDERNHIARSARHKIQEELETTDTEEPELCVFCGAVLEDYQEEICEDCMSKDVEDRGD